jgi:hypothetical protein
MHLQGTKPWTPCCHRLLSRSSNVTLRWQCSLFPDIPQDHFRVLADNSRPLRRSGLSRIIREVDDSDFCVIDQPRQPRTPYRRTTTLLRKLRSSTSSRSSSTPSGKNRFPLPTTTGQTII